MLITQVADAMRDVINLGSGYSSGSGWQVIHAIRPAQPRDAIERLCKQLFVRRLSKRVAEWL